MSQIEALNITNKQQVARLGSVSLRTDIRTSMGPFHCLPEYKIQYPEVVTRALTSLYTEYNQAFDPLVRANREWDTDYRHGMRGPGGSPTNYFVQIDMVGLPDSYLQAASVLREEQVCEDLRGKIFEIENSLAMYQLLNRLFSNPEQDSLFGTQFRGSLDVLRQIHNMPIALLAVTEQKNQAMRESEFGKQTGETLTNAEVKELSGFDAFFGPEEFLHHVKQNGGDSEYLLYVRSSDPVAKLKKPDTVVENPLLLDSDLRRIIKSYSITFNIDDPDMPIGSPSRINDTKAYLAPMEMAYPIDSDTDLDSPEFRQFLISKGIDPTIVELGQSPLRAKPLQSSYGCYGHLRSIDKKFRSELRRELRRRGPYVVQPEMQTPLLINETDGQAYTFIDRNFLSTDGENYRFMGGFRSLMPLNSVEAQNGRVHGNGATVWAEIY